VVEIAHKQRFDDGRNITFGLTAVPEKLKTISSANFSSSPQPFEFKQFYDRSSIIYLILEDGLYPSICWDVEVKIEVVW